MPQHPIDPILLTTLVAVAETGSLAGAAARVGRTPSAVSMQMRKLAEMAGEPPLFERTGRGLRLTPRGEALLAHARRILAFYQQANAMLATTRAAGLVRLGTPDGYIGSLLPKALGRLARIHPDVEVTIACEPSGALSRLVEEGGIDVALVAQAPSIAGRAVQLRQEPLHWVASPGHEVHRGAVVPLALFQPGCLGRGLALEAWAKLGRPFRIAYSSPSASCLLAVVRQGLAVAPLPRCAVPPDLVSLGPADGFPVLPALPIGLMQSEAAGSNPAAQALAAILRATLSTAEPERAIA